MLAAMENDPGKERLAELLAAALEAGRQGRSAEARRLCEQVLAVDPGEPDALHVLAVQALGEGKSEEAAALAGRAADGGRGRPWIYWHTAGEAERAAGRWEAAAAAYQRAVELQPGWLRPRGALGTAMQRLGRIEEAEVQFRLVLRADTRDAHVLDGLGRLLFETDRLPEAVTLFTRLAATSPEAFEGHFNLGVTLLSLGRREAARAALSRARELDPAHEAAAFFLQVAEGEGGEGPERMPARVAADLFDGYAEGFDRHLVEKLGYRAPAALREFLDRHGGASPGLTILDLGCGTGLAGEAFRDLAARGGALIGLDLSHGMLEKARARGIYADLIEGDLLETDWGAAGRIDLIVAADVLVYLGDLAEVFRRAAKLLKPGGLLLFSTEAGAGEGFQLGEGGRFTHARGYVESQAGLAGFESVAQEDFTPRLHKDQPVVGRRHLFRRA